MNTPIVDFARRYADTAAARFHMPGHKGTGPMGIEALDLTEIGGADELYEADGIIAESEANAAALFGSAKTIYSTEGSTQCIKAMLYLAMQEAQRRKALQGADEGTSRTSETKTWILAARNVHKAFVFAAGLLDLAVEWLWPEETDEPLVSCTVTGEQLETALTKLTAAHDGTLPAAVYLTSPDYLGTMAELAPLAEVCHAHGVLLLVDNAHGAYLRFLKPSQHPLDHGADLCCDSAHKTLPVLTGGAYLHIAKGAPESLGAAAERAMAMFCSTSPSYLILQSLDHANAYLAGDYADRLAAYIEEIEFLKIDLRLAGYEIPESDPLRLVIRTISGFGLHASVRSMGGECEFADASHLVFMLTPENGRDGLNLIRDILFTGEAMSLCGGMWPQAQGGTAVQLQSAERVMSIREALFARSERIPVRDAIGRISAAPSVSCPPAVPIAVSGERITAQMADLFRACGIKTVDVICE